MMLQHLRPKPLLTFAALTLAVLWIGAPVLGASSLQSEEHTTLLESARVDPELVHVLTHAGRAYAAITLSLPDPLDPAYVGHPAQGSDVNPLVFDLVNAFLPGEIDMFESGPFVTLNGLIDAQAVMTLLHEPHIVAFDLAEQPAHDPGDALLNTSAALAQPCVPSTTTACIQNGNFAVSVSNARVAATSSQSAVFYFFNSSNWEVLVKVLNGCSINGYFWVFAAGATSQSYTITVSDHRQNPAPITRTFGSTCPLTNTTAFSCLVLK